MDSVLGLILIVAGLSSRSAPWQLSPTIQTETLPTGSSDIRQGGRDQPFGMLASKILHWRQTSMGPEAPDGPP